MAEAIVQAPRAKTNLSRRSILAGAAALPLAALPAVAAGVDRAAWESALIAYRASELPFLDALEAHSDARDAFAADTAKLPPKPYGLRLYPPPPGDPAEDLMVRAHRLAQTEAQAYEAQVAALRRRHRLDELALASDAARRANDEALNALMTMPAPDIAALAEKIEIAIYEASMQQFEHELLLDAQRFAGKAVA